MSYYRSPYTFAKKKPPIFFFHSCQTMFIYNNIHFSIAPNYDSMNNIFNILLITNIS